MTAHALTDRDKAVSAATYKSQVVTADPDRWEGYNANQHAVATLLHDCLAWLADNADPEVYSRVVQDLHDETSEVLAQQD